VSVETWLPAMAIGMGGTLTIDLWALLLRRVFGVKSLDYCLLGRWMLHMSEGTFRHTNIGTATPKRYECPMGWMVHYSIGAAFALAFVWIVGTGWLVQPALLPALAFGVVTVLVPFFVMQPALGLGIASSRAPHPWGARLRSLATHAVFGLGLWMWALILWNAGYN